MNIPILRARAGVAFTIIRPGGFRILAALDQATKMLAHDLTITAATDSHTTGRHASGEAYDVSVAVLTIPQILQVKRFLAHTLGDRFTVLYETPTVPTDPQLVTIATINGDATGPHLHIQVRKGTEYPPSEVPGTLV